MENHNSSWDHDNMTVAYNNMTVDYDNMTVDYDNMTVAYDNMTVDYDNMTVDCDNMTVDYDYMTVDCDNMTVDYDYMTVYYYNSIFEKLFMSSRVMNSIVVSCGIPLCAVAVYVLYSLVRRHGKPAPVFVINLLISDVLQICCLFVSIPLDSIKHQGHTLWSIVVYIYIFCLPVSTAFMACIALERYLLVVWPLWYHFRRSTRHSVVVSVLVWILCPAVSVVLLFHGTELISTIFSIFSLLPVLLFLFCLAATLRALSSCRLPAEEKRRIVAVLVLVLLIYSLLFLPAVITLLTWKRLIIYDLPFILLRLNPLADLALYVFMQKGAVDKVLASVCCCKLNGGDSSIASP
ncbi:uncharacterized protein V6R79_005201 [Siganus canaliculatus]